MRKKIVVLKYEPKHGGNLFSFVFRRINDFPVFGPCRPLSMIENLTAVNGFQHGGTPQKRCFTGTGWPDNRKDLAFVDRKRDILQDTQPLKGFLYMVHFEQCHSPFFLPYL